MIAPALRTIERQIRTISDDVHEFDLDALQHALRVIAIQIGSQAEIIEEGLDE